MHAIWFKGSEPILAIPGGPFRANSREEFPRVNPGLCFTWPLPATDWKRPNYMAASVRTPLFFQAECGVLGNVIRIDQNAVNSLFFVLTGFSVFNVFIRLINS